MANNFDLRKFLAEGSFAKETKTINESGQFPLSSPERRDGEEEQEINYYSPCEKIENQLMNMYQKHGNDLIDVVRRVGTAEAETGQNSPFARRLVNQFINVGSVIKVSQLNYRYKTNGCGDPREFAEQFFGVSNLDDLFEGKEDVNEGGLAKKAYDFLMGVGVNEGEDEHMEESSDPKGIQNPFKEMGKDLKKFTRIFNRHGIDNKGFFQELHDFVFGQPRPKGDDEGNSIDRMMDDLFENYDEEEEGGKYNSPCSKLEDQLMRLFDKHGDDLIDAIRREHRASQKSRRLGNRLLQQFKEVKAFIKISSVSTLYNMSGCGDAEELFHDYFGIDDEYDLYESEDLKEGIKDSKSYKFIVGKKDGEVKEETVNEGRGDLDTIIDAIENHAEYGTDGYDIEEAFEEIFAELGDHYGYDISFTKKANEGKEEE